MGPDQCDLPAAKPSPDGVVPLSQSALSRLIRRRLRLLLNDDSKGERAGIAIYTLADPRDVRCVRYVGQTRDPARRYQQHVRTARLWMAAETPWWVRLPRLRALYVWIRQLYADDMRLPFMLVIDWCGDAAVARRKEREFVERYANLKMPLLNFEAEGFRQRAASAQIAELTQETKKKPQRKTAGRKTKSHGKPASGVPPPAGSVSQD
jgi:hypothetical protein